MNKILPDGKTIEYVTPPELQTSQMDADSIQLYEELYKTAEVISNELKVEIPYIGLKDKLHRHDPETGKTCVYGGECYRTSDFPMLEHDVIILSLEDRTPGMIEATLAHEIKHIEQEKYPRDVSKIMRADTPAGAKMNLAEIDADSYAIRFLVNHTDMSLEEAVNIVCPIRSKTDVSFAIIRILRAMGI